MISQLGKIILHDSISSTIDFDNYFYKKAFSIIISINLISAIFLLVLNPNLGITFSAFTIIYSYIFINYYDKFFISFPKISFAILLNIQAMIMIKYFNIGHATDWFFAIPSVYALHTFNSSKERVIKYFFVSISSIAFIYVGLFSFTIDHTIAKELMPLAQLIYRLDVVVITLGLIIIWQKANRELITFIQTEDKLVNEILNALPLPIFCKDSHQNFKIVYRNNSAKKSLGTEKDHFIFSNESTQKLSTQQKEIFRNEDYECIKSQKAITIKNAKVQMDNQQLLYLNYTKIPVYGRYILVIPENITKQVENSQNLFNYKYSLDKAAIISFSDVAGNITYANDLFCEISGYSNDELIGQNHRLLKSGKHDSEFYKEIWDKISTGKIWQGEICNRKKTGELYWVFSTIIPNKDPDGKISQFISIRFDITHKKSIEDKISYSEKFSVLGELAAGIMHEVNTPLTVIQNRSSMLAKKLNQLPIENKEPIFKDIKAISDSIDRIAKITKGLKNYSRNSEKDPFENIDIIEIINESITLCQDKIKLHSIILNFNQPDLPIMISCRRSEISQIFINMINNSIDAIENFEDKWIKISLEINNNEVIIKFLDSGLGISQTIQDKIMQPFFTTKENGKGTGLGLSISQNILKTHGGRMNYVKESPNTLFEINLPIAVLEPQKIAQ